VTRPDGERKASVLSGAIQVIARFVVSFVSDPLTVRVNVWSFGVPGRIPILRMHFLPRAPIFLVTGFGSGTPILLMAGLGSRSAILLMAAWGTARRLGAALRDVVLVTSLRVLLSAPLLAAALISLRQGVRAH